MLSCDDGSPVLDLRVIVSCDLSTFICHVIPNKAFYSAVGTMFSDSLQRPLRPALASVPVTNVDHLYPHALVILSLTVFNPVFLAEQFDFEVIPIRCSIILRDAGIFATMAPTVIIQRHSQWHEASRYSSSSPAPSAVSSAADHETAYCRLAYMAAPFSPTTY